jgi:hypothetical protein
MGDIPQRQTVEGYVPIAALFGEKDKHSVMIGLTISIIAIALIIALYIWSKTRSGFVPSVVDTCGGPARPPLGYPYRHDVSDRNDEGTVVVPPYSLESQVSLGRGALTPEVAELARERRRNGVSGNTIVGIGKLSLVREMQDPYQGAPCALRLSVFEPREGSRDYLEAEGDANRMGILGSHRLPGTGVPARGYPPAFYTDGPYGAGVLQETPGGSDQAARALLPPSEESSDLQEIEGVTSLKKKHEGFGSTAVAIVGEEADVGGAYRDGVFDDALPHLVSSRRLAPNTLTGYDVGAGAAVAAGGNGRDPRFEFQAPLPKPVPGAAYGARIAAQAARDNHATRLESHAGGPTISVLLPFEFHELEAEAPTAPRVAAGTADLARASDTEAPWA